jgi:hypothetical protein
VEVVEVVEKVEKVEEWCGDSVFHAPMQKE